MQGKLSNAFKVLTFYNILSNNTYNLELHFLLIVTNIQVLRMNIEILVKS